MWKMDYEILVPESGPYQISSFPGTSWWVDADTCFPMPYTKTGMSWSSSSSTTDQSVRQPLGKFKLNNDNDARYTVYFFIWYQPSPCHPPSPHRYMVRDKKTNTYISALKTTTQFTSQLLCEMPVSISLSFRKGLCDNVSLTFPSRDLCLLISAISWVVRPSPASRNGRSCSTSTDCRNMARCSSRSSRWEFIHHL